MNNEPKFIRYAVDPFWEDKQMRHSIAYSYFNMRNTQLNASNSCLMIPPIGWDCE